MVFLHSPEIQGKVLQLPLAQGPSFPSSSTPTTFPSARGGSKEDGLQDLLSVLDSEGSLHAKAIST